MDRASANTLRTLGIVLTSILLIIISAVLLLLSLCLGMLGGWGQSGGHHDPQTVELFYASLLGLVVVLVVGGAIIGKLARGIVRDTAPGPGSAKTHAAFPLHLSTSSQAAVRRLVLAIAAQLVLGSLTWLWSLAVALPRYHSLTLAWSFIGSGLLSNAPYIALLIGLVRAPGRRTFAYALAIPAVLTVFGLLGGSSLLLYLTRTQGLMALYSLIVPRLLHIVVFYFAWKAIQQIGIHPDPGSLILAAFVTLGYFLVLPAVMGTLIYSSSVRPSYGPNAPLILLSGPGLLLLILGGIVGAVMYRSRAPLSPSHVPSVGTQSPPPIASELAERIAEAPKIDPLLPQASETPAHLLSDTAIPPPVEAPKPVSRPVAAPAISAPATPMRLAPDARQSIQQLITAIAVQFVCCAVVLLASLRMLWSPLAYPIPFTWWHTALLPLLALQLPYTNLISALRKKPNHTAFAYSITIPGIMGLFYLSDLPRAGFLYHSSSIALIILFAAAPVLVQVIVFWFASRAIQRNGVRVDAPAVVAAGLVSAFYFALVHVANPYLYRLGGI